MVFPVTFSRVMEVLGKKNLYVLSVVFVCHEVLTIGMLKMYV